MGEFNTALFNQPLAGGGTIAGAGVLVSDLLRSSFRCIGQLLPGFGYSDSELTDALFILNAMLDSWAVDELNAYCTLTQSFALVAGQAQYTVGPQGNWDASRPVKVTKAMLVVMTNPASPLHLELQVINSDQFQSIPLPGTGSTIPQRLYYATSYPYATANLWPVPQSSADLVWLSSWQPIAGAILDGATTFSVPPGYLDAVRYHLAIRLAMEWDKPLKEGVVMLATEALAKIQRLNAQTPQMDCNPGIMPIRSGRSGFNYRTGD
jgi:hypothetical protein